MMIECLCERVFLAQGLMPFLLDLESESWRDVLNPLKDQDDTYRTLRDGVELYSIQTARDDVYLNRMAHADGSMRLIWMLRMSGIYSRRS
jgi:hypothetical protein